MKRQKFDNEILIFSVKSPSVFIVKSGPIADKTESSKGMISINLGWYCLYIFEHTTAASAPPTRLEITSGATTNRKSGNRRPVVGGCLCIQLIRGGALYINTPSSLKKRDKSVGNVGNVGKSEKSPENFPRKVFQNAYIAYTTYIG